MVNNLNVFRAGIGPATAQPPLIVYTNAVLAGVIALRFLKSNRRR
jgi:hypothetical protein